MVVARTSAFIIVLLESSKASALEKINEAWKVALEEMYKAQAEAQQSGSLGPDAESAQAEGDKVGDVDFEEVK